MSSPIEKLVPKLEECLKISDSLLGPTVFVWRKNENGWEVVRADRCSPDDTTFPAPTFEELYRAIMKNEDVHSVYLDSFIGISLSITLYEDVHHPREEEMEKGHPNLLHPIRFMENVEKKDRFERNPLGGNLADLALEAWMFVNDLLPSLRKSKILREARNRRKKQE